MLLISVRVQLLGLKLSVRAVSVVRGAPNLPDDDHMQDM